MEIIVQRTILDSPDDERFKSVIDKHADWIIDQGLLPTKTKLEKKDKVATYLLKNILYYRFHAEITQFVNGLDKVGLLHKEILHAPEAFSSLFVHQAVHLKFDTFRLLYEVNFSPEGSNNRRLEKDTVYFLEVFLIECDGKESDIALADVLMFWTGASSVPPMGFDKKLEVDFVTADRKLPVAHTCGMVLELVCGLADPDLFKEDMVKAIKWSGGFHLC
ncbi:G2/M phase-specific E3 ubiquitin-protein ligase-like [Mercenaria mercenaria]|uniref:G2/M phase-specific E3 ubiquitin-protein ligase-like n=1 Tax=Mercenaria mercenaria TaxID=6596 RepID=UPI00234F1469|nr:G2/M phase-specific E3 ubiquitin-protein ligase-like [Mercenaria mercenaria]